ncbi:MAG: hypothetical protein JWQ16_1576 [Novosphingobium sp.]|nr:hypothetical protein [Novosphingobium sp.]
MTNPAQLADIEAIKQAKARYIRGVDEGDAAVVQAILHPACRLDYVGCFVDPATGHDFFPAMSIVLEGRDKFGSALVHLGIVSAHHIYNGEVVLTGETTAEAVFPMTDRLWFPADGQWPYAQLTGFGHYRETYEKIGGEWLLKTTRVTRLRVEGA